MDKPYKKDLDQRDKGEAATAQSVANLVEIVRELRELADQDADLKKQPLFEPTYH